VDALRDETFELNVSEDVVRLRQRVRAWAVEIGFSLIDQTKIVTAASELARNTVEHGKGGSARLRWLVNGGRVGFRMDFVDAGPGIADVALAVKDGYSTGTGLGLGLAGSKRLMGEFEIESEPGRGTRVSVARWK
jgi:serine/threonine-protein kinase RsbT